MACAFIYLLLAGRWLLALICAVGFAGIWVIGFMRPDLFNWENTLGFIFDQRVGIWKNAWDAYVSSPRSVLIGRGPMTYFFAKVSDAKHAHNILFDTLINVGVIGLGLYVALLIDIMRDAWNNFKCHGREWLVSAVMVAEILVQGVFDVTIMWLQTGLMFMILVLPVAKPRPDQTIPEFADVRKN
jgi:O-antigen ligase